MSAPLVVALVASLCAYSAGMTVSVTSGRELALAFANETVSEAVVSVAYISFSDGDWAGLGSPHVLLLRNLTISGNESLVTGPPVLDLNGTNVKNKVRV